MTIEFDPNKNQRNIETRGIDFNDAALFNWDTAVITKDTRKDYGEPRFIAYGTIEGRLMVLVFTLRGETLRVISLRKANEREAKRYGNS